MHLEFGVSDGMGVAGAPVEIVERKGLGHPDTVCDFLAEQVSQALCRHYRENFGLILHHNVDKVLLRGGASKPAFGGGEVVEPIEIYLAGRATQQVNTTCVPVEDIATTACKNWLGRTFHALDVERHVGILCLIRPGSADLVDLFRRQQETGVWLANDTSIGVGYAPDSDTESVVREVEAHLNSSAFKSSAPETGEDIKIMGVRRGGNLSLTIACAFISRHIPGAGHYEAAKRRVAEAALKVARNRTGMPVGVQVNTADDPARGSYYLTITGTSAESGDDGQTGRGNRLNGLITPYRPMTIEAAAGKNPVSHVGKIYNVAAGLMARALVAGIDEVREAECYLVSRIGHPVAEPQTVDVRLRTADGRVSEAARQQAGDLVRDQLSKISRLYERIVAGEFPVA